MIPIRLFSLFLVGFFLVSFSLVLIPNDGFAQEGCCINNGVNCVGCSTGPCQVPPNNCTGQNMEFFPGEFCYDPPPPGQNIAECLPSGCCQIEQGNCYQTNSVTCATNGDSFLGNGACQPQFDAECSALGCCQTPGQDPQSCQIGVTQLACETGGGAWTEGVSCDGNFCGQAPPPTGCCQDEPNAPACQEGVTEAQCGQGTWTEGNVMCDGDFCGEAPIGCCQIEPGECDDVTEAECQGGTFFEGGMCPASGFCEPPPVGCCICGENECSQTTELECQNMGGCEYQGDNTSCSNFDICNVEPEGCCVLPENPGLSLSNLLDMILDNCVIETESQCNAQGGDYQGDGVSCDQVPQCLPAPARNVPTLSQWGMIVVAGLLGIYSLMIIRRRSKYNVG